MTKHYFLCAYYLYVRTKHSRCAATLSRIDSTEEGDEKSLYAVVKIEFLPKDKLLEIIEKARDRVVESFQIIDSQNRCIPGTTYENKKVSPNEVVFLHRPLEELNLSSRKRLHPPPFHSSDELKFHKFWVSLSEEAKESLTKKIDDVVVVDVLTRREAEKIWSELEIAGKQKTYTGGNLAPKSKNPSSDIKHQFIDRWLSECVALAEKYRDYIASSSIEEPEELGAPLEDGEKFQNAVVIFSQHYFPSYSSKEILKGASKNYLQANKTG